MSTEEEGGLFSCPIMCWIIGALLGLATYLILAGRFMMGTTLSLIIAVVVFAAAGYLLGRLFCRPSLSTHGHPARHDHDIAATRQSVVSADSSGAMVSGVPDVVEKTTSNGAAAAAASVAKASKADSAVAGAKPAAKGKAAGTAKSKAKSASAAGTGAKKATTKPAAKPAAKAKAASKPATKAKAAAKPAAKTKAVAKPAAKAKVASKTAAASKTATKPVAKKPAAKAVAKKPAAKTATKPARKSVAKDGKPEMLKKARTGGADNLKEIKGVGPKMETMLNKMGIYHFDQVSNWRAKEVQWVDENLEGFKGRVSRDEWVKQAKILARGGETEFSKKVEKGGVYAKNKK